VGALPANGLPVNENLPPAFGFPEYPVAEKLPKVTPLAVGTVVGSVNPLPIVTLVKGYVPVNACPKATFVVKSKILQSKINDLKKGISILTPKTE
jgi:hypothetical protein